MAIQATSQDRQYSFLRRVLQVNGLFSGLSGALFVVAAGPISSFLGLTTPWILIVVGISLLLYAVALFQTAASRPLNRQFAAAAIILDTAWVVASAAILMSGWQPLTNSGWWAIAIVADVVAVFAALQFYGLRRAA